MCSKASRHIFMRNRSREPFLCICIIMVRAAIIMYDRVAGEVKREIMYMKEMRVMCIRRR